MKQVLEHVGQPKAGEDRFAEFIAANQHALFRFCMSLTGSQHDAWDLLQDGYSRLLDAWPRVDNARDPLAYARQTLTRLHFNRARSAKRELAAFVRVREASTTTLPDATFEPWLEDSYRRLAPKQRAAIALVHIWGFTIREAADTMQCRENTVKTHLARGMEHLRSAARTAGKDTSHDQLQ